MYLESIFLAFPFRFYSLSLLSGGLQNRLNISNDTPYRFIIRKYLKGSTYDVPIKLYYWSLVRKW